MTILEISLLDLWLTAHNYILRFFGYDGKLQYVKTGTNQTTTTETLPTETLPTVPNPTVPNPTVIVEDDHIELKNQVINGC